MSLLDVSDLEVRYGDDVVVNKVSFAVESGEAVGLVGESGSGKTQTALAILGLLPRNAALSGSIQFGGTELVGASEAELNLVRGRRAAMVFQDPMQALNPYVRIGDQLRRVLLAHDVADKDEAHGKVIQMLETVGLPDPERQSRSYPHQLSGGMRQRAMIASALITDPDLLIADEPTTALDVTVQAQVLELLREIRKDTALLLITHDLGVVAGNCERMIVFNDGRVVESGATQDVFASPKDPHTRALLAAAPRLDRADLPESVETKALLEVAGTSVSYVEPRVGALHAVRDVGFEICAGETVAIVGESGSGKSSLVRAVLGLVPADAGTTSYLGETLAADVRERTSTTRRDLQLVFQDPVGSLDPQMSVFEIVREPLTVHEPETDTKEAAKRISEILTQVGLDDSFNSRYAHELSGGQAQRVAIARALIVEPKILICDEAVAALDGSVRDQVLGLLRHVQRRSGLSIIFISHDLGVVRAISHRVLVMYLGRLVEFASNAALFAKPRHPYTRALIDAVPAPDPRATRQAPLQGEVPSVLEPPPGCAFHPRCPHAIDTCSTERPEPRSLKDVTVACHRAEELEL